MPFRVLQYLGTKKSPKNPVSHSDTSPVIACCKKRTAISWEGLGGQEKMKKKAAVLKRMPYHSKRLAAEPGEPLDSVADVGDRHEDEEDGGPHASPGGPRRKVGAGARAVLVHKVVDDDDGLRDADDEQGLTPRQALDHATHPRG